MPILTLTEAAKETGLSRSAVFKAIKSGKVSATKDENGHFQIDPAELFRVYDPVNKENVSSEQQETAREPKETAENMVLKVRLETMGELLRQVQSERDDLRRRLDDEAAERRNLTALLTYKPEPPTAPEIEAPPAILPAVLPSQQEAPEAPAPVRSRWEAASLTFAAVFAALVVSLAVAHWIGWI